MNPTMKMTSMIGCVMLLNCMVMQITGSAIPMWEFLSKDEKKGFLYKAFIQQIAEFCATSSRPDCSKNALITGTQNLVNMNDSVLNGLDPYQRGAKETIWRALMGTNELSTINGNRIEEEPYPRRDSLSDQLASSGSETNTLEEETDPMDIYARAGPYLGGPMVIRVYPDGRPVPEDMGRPLPKDDDIEDMRHTRLSEEMKKNMVNHFSRISSPSKVSRYGNGRFKPRQVRFFAQTNSLPESTRRNMNLPYNRRYHDIVRYY